jgi:protease IV
MGQFFKFFFASCLGVIVAMAVLLGVGTLVVTAIASQVDKPMEVRPNSVLRINLDKAIPEKTNNLEMDPFDFKNQKNTGASRYSPHP